MSRRWILSTPDTVFWFCSRDEEEVNSFPVVKESAGKLIETGINTLQKTLLLKREVEVDTVHAELQEKRAEFKRRMEICTERQIEIQKKQQKVCCYCVFCEPG